MSRVVAGAVLVLTGCFDPTYNNPACGPQGECPSGTTCTNGVCMTGGGDDDDGGTDPDAIDGAIPDDSGDGSPPIDGPPFTVTFLPASASTPGTGDWIVNTAGSIDTTALTGMPPFPAGVTLTASMQVDISAPEVAVLHVDRMQLGAGATLRVRGSRPLVIVAGSDVVIDGFLDAGATIVTPGAGGHDPGSGPGLGGPGDSQNNLFNDDSGGGGAGFGSMGAVGGNTPNNNGGFGGVIVGGTPPTQLRGGSGGGTGGFDGCPPPLGGAGGGGIAIASATQITITGGINSGGGGGSGGLSCSDAPGGGGGGAGGQIDLQAPSYTATTGMVLLAANGGGGGGGGSNAQSGVDGFLGSLPAQGGMSGGGTSATAGGTGAATTINAAPGGGGGNNAGGGGGGVGRITVRYRGAQPAITASPPATFVTY